MAQTHVLAFLVGPAVALLHQVVWQLNQKGNRNRKNPNLCVRYHKIAPRQVCMTTLFLVLKVAGTEPAGKRRVYNFQPSQQSIAGNRLPARWSFFPLRLGNFLLQSGNLRIVPGLLLDQLTGSGE